MPRLIRSAARLACALMLLAALPGTAIAQHKAVPRHPPHPQPAVTVRGQVFIGGYFYDPFFGPYPWWQPFGYPNWYFPAYDNRAEIRLRIEPQAATHAAVYVDGFYAGIVDDFNSVFQSLPLTPGGHTLVLFLDGYRTASHNIYLRPGSTFQLRDTMVRLAAGDKSEPPPLAAAVPTPPAGSYRLPHTPNRGPTRAAVVPKTAGFGTLDLFVRPALAEVTIDGQRWVTSDEGHFVVQVPAGTHRIEVSKPGYWQFTAGVAVREGAATALSVSLMPGDDDAEGDR